MLPSYGLVELPMTFFIWLVAARIIELGFMIGTQFLPKSGSFLLWSLLAMGLLAVVIFPETGRLLHRTRGVASLLYGPEKMEKSDALMRNQELLEYQDVAYHLMVDL